MFKIPSLPWFYNANEELHNLNSSPVVKEAEMGRACSTNGAKRNAYRILIGKPEGKRPLGRQRCRWNDNIKTNLRNVG
jgi:hypothetical protein